MVKMTKKSAVGVSALALCLLLAGGTAFHSVTEWSRTLHRFLAGAETVTGEACLGTGGAKTLRVPLSREQAEEVLQAVRDGSLRDNREFAGTTEEGWIELQADGVDILLGCLWDTEIKYRWNGERRSVRASGKNYRQSTREILRSAFPEELAGWETSNAHLITE